MAPKKYAKRAKMKKTTAKSRTSHKGVLSLAEKVEKEFRQIPTKLAKLYRQEVMTLKQQEAKWKAEIKKAELSQKAAENKHRQLANATMTKTAKKQFAAAKKTLAQANKTIKELSTNLAKISKNINDLVAKQMKYTALNTELAKIEKQLIQKIKAPVPAPKKDVKKVKLVKQKQPKEITHTAEDQMEEPFPMTTKTPETVEME